MRKKILILYSTGGMGHKKAALALYEEILGRKDQGVEAEIVDVLEYGSWFYKAAYLHVYVFLMSRAKWIWGFLYYVTNRRFLDRITRLGRAGIDNAALPGLADMILESDPDAVIATHFLLPSIAGILKRKGLKARLYALITDYGPHAWWISPHIDTYFVGGENVRKDMRTWGIPGDKVEVSGIATSGDFSRDMDRSALMEKYGLDGGRKTVFTMSGGFGVGPMQKILLSLNSCKSEIQVITVCGHNENIYREIEAMKDRFEYPLLLKGFTDKVAELMAVSDVMITKAGGVSVTEALNSRLPMIFYASMPGQEIWNERLLVEKKAAVKAMNIREIPVIVDRMLAPGDEYESYLAGIDGIRRPEASKSIIDRVFSDINSWNS